MRCSCASFTSCSRSSSSRWATTRFRFLNALDFPLSDQVEARLGELQRFTPTIDALFVPDIDASLDEQEKKTEFWNAFKALGPWWAELPPY